MGDSGVKAAPGSGLSAIAAASIPPASWFDMSESSEMKEWRSVVADQRAAVNQMKKRVKKLQVVDCSSSLPPFASPSLRQFLGY